MQKYGIETAFSQEVSSLDGIIYGIANPRDGGARVGKPYDFFDRGVPRSNPPHGKISNTIAASRYLVGCDLKRAYDRDERVIS
jgi:hypothetical protein